jgi:tRNA modification GTPase
MIICGARLAEPGEFTKRAFLNGRIDLLQAESVRDVIEAKTDEELRYAERSLQGDLSRKIGSLKERLRRTLVEVEALIDFPEEDVGVDEKEILSSLERAQKEIELLVDSYYEGNAIRHGLEVLMVGKTNVGKSSILNRLLAREKAIVTSLPGTTRDLIEDTIHVEGIKVRLVDTAGMGQTKDPVEKEGMERVRQRIPEADLILLIIDGSRPCSTEDLEIFKEIGDRRMIVAVNKIDLPQFFERDLLKEKGLESIEISALKGLGVEDLKQAIYRALMGKRQRGNSLLITNVRHRNGLSRALEALQRAVRNTRSEEPVEFIAFDLREALSHLEEITGEACSDDILQDIFSRFCIGK